MGAELNPESRVGKIRVDDASGTLWARLGKAEEELQVHREKLQALVLRLEGLERRHAAATEEQPTVRTEVIVAAVAAPARNAGHDRDGQRGED